MAGSTKQKMKANNEMHYCTKKVIGGNASLDDEDDEDEDENQQQTESETEIPTNHTGITVPCPMHLVTVK
jgi:hypothetical protein